jgi:hypothetical protein
MIQAKRQNGISSCRILPVDVCDNPREIGGGFRRPFDFHLRTEDSVHLAAYVLVRNRLALIERSEALANLLPEPFIMIKIGRNQLAHYLVWSFARLRGDPIQLGFEFRSKRDFHGLIVGGPPIKEQRILKAGCAPSGVFREGATTSVPPATRPLSSQSSVTRVTDSQPAKRDNDLSLGQARGASVSQTSERWPPEAAQFSFWVLFDNQAQQNRR